MRKIVFAIIISVLIWPTQNFVRHQFADAWVQGQLSQLHVSLDLLADAGEESLRKSDTLEIEGFGTVRVGMTKEERLISFAQEFETVGLQPVRLVFADPQTLGAEKDYWQAVFPGCKPRQCRDIIQTMDLTPTTASVRDDYRAGHHGRETVELPERTRFGVTYAIIAVVFRDRFGAVTQMELLASREFRDASERIFAIMSSGGGAKAQRVFWTRSVIAQLDPG